MHSDQLVAGLVQLTSWLSPWYGLLTFVAPYDHKRIWYVADGSLGSLAKLVGLQYRSLQSRGHSKLNVCETSNNYFVVYCGNNNKRLLIFSSFIPRVLNWPWSKSTRTRHGVQNCPNISTRFNVQPTEAAVSLLYALLRVIEI